MADKQVVGSWYHNEERWARQTAASWLAHPQVRPAVEAATPHAARMVAPLAGHLVDQIQITRFCWRVCGIGACYPDGSEDPNPFDPAAPGAWPLTVDERKAAGYVAAEFHQLVQLVAQVLEGAGVPLDAQWGSDQAVVAVLLLLPAACYQVPWDADPRELADLLQPPGVSAISRDGRMAWARDGRPEVMARNADRIRKLIRQEAGGRQLRRPYAAASGQRALPRATMIHREVLGELLAVHPDVTVQRLLMTWSNSEGTAGGRLRCELTRRLAAEGLPAPDKPARATLYADLQRLGLRPA